MTYHFILLFTLFHIVTVHRATANYCEGHYTTNNDEILQQIEAELNGQGQPSGVTRFFKSIFLRDKGFKDICQECTMEEKLSICMKVLQHKLKKYRPVSFTVNPNESTFQCPYTMYYGRNSNGICNVYQQRMYACPTTTIKYRRADRPEGPSEEPFFLIGQGLHGTQHRIRFCDCTSQAGAALIQGQLTGFEPKALKFEKSLSGLYTYKPDYGYPEERETECSIVPFRQCGDINDYIFNWGSYP